MTPLPQEGHSGTRKVSYDLFLKSTSPFSRNQTDMRVGERSTDHLGFVEVLYPLLPVVEHNPPIQGSILIADLASRPYRAYACNLLLDQTE